jgi:putative Holliday junction resolvase
LRVLGVDLGTKRIGLALSDGEGRIASPLLVVYRKGGKADLREVAQIARDYEAEEIVVGLPLNLRGERAEAVQAAEREIQTLRDLAGMRVEVWDERMTSAVAQRGMSASGLDTRQQRGVVDKVAATVMLQSYLERRRREDGAPEPT